MDKKTSNETPQYSLSRRNLLKAAVVAPFAAPAFIPSTVLGRDGAVAPSERIVLGGIGLGGRGSYVLRTMLQEKDVQFVAAADVQRSRRENIKNIVDGHYGNQDCEITIDMFEILERQDIDAVLIATGDRWHALASILSVKAGKDVYCEKPCAMSIGEAQALSDAVTRYGRVFQVGTQRRSQSHFQYAAHLARSGQLGNLQSLHASVYVPSKNDEWLPEQPEPAREECDWDRWLGPVPWVPYNSNYVAGGWHGRSDFLAGGSNFLDWGSHTVDLCLWANPSDEPMPVEYEATDEAIIGTYKNGLKIVCDYLPTPFGSREPKFHTHTGTCPVRFNGDKGWVETGDSGQIVFSDSLAELRKRRFANIGTSPAGHGRNFLDCVKSRALPVCNQHVMRRSHIACFAAQMSWHLGRKVTFDPATETFVNDEEANRRSIRAAREPWNYHV